ncbi:MAG: hypothetical protein JJD98_18735 [Polaromonas sp.]|nr:hypothetical protein [Polaromonas sp.]
MAIGFRAVVSPMGRLRVAVIGLGRLGKSYAEALLDADTLNLAGIV